MLTRGVWVIDQSGLCLFQRSWGLPFIDKDQFAGMFTALFHFSKEITNQDFKDATIKRLEQFKWDKYYFSVEEHKGFFFVICSEGVGDPPQELFLELQSAFFKIFKDQFILLGDLLKNAGPTKQEKQRLGKLVDQIVKVGNGSQFPMRKISLTDIYKKKGNCQKLAKLKDQIETMAVLLQCSGHTSIKEISKYTNLTEKSVKKILRKLDTLDLIEFSQFDKNELSKRVRL